MPKLGFPLRFPLNLGGGEDLHAVEHQAVLAALQKGFDTNSTSGVYCEAYADATACEFVWSCSRRLSGQFDPQRMLEALPDWEEACGLHPSAGDTDVARRDALTAKLRGLSGNALPDINDVCSQSLGTSFAGIQVTTPDIEVTYWPGINPGPPGKEWSSNRARIAVVIDATGLDDVVLESKLAALRPLLNTLLPAWMTFDVSWLGYLI